MAKKIFLITDSTCDIPRHLIEEHQILVVPLTIIWGDEQFQDGVDLQPEDFYRRLESDPAFPSTSQPSPGDMLEAYQTARERGAEEILVLTLSSAMSGTHESAVKAAEGFDLPVHVHDSKSNSMGLGWQVLAAAQARDAGDSPRKMMEKADQVRKNMRYLISLDTLEYLHRGGRIGGASRFIGTLLNLKPQIAVNHQTGEVEGGRRSRTRKKALGDLYDDFTAGLDPQKTIRVAVLHNASLDAAEQLADRIEEEYAPEELLINIVSPILGVHTGPRAVAICGYAL